MSILVRVLVALMALIAAPAWAQQPVTLEGSVTYRERIALPQNAWLKVMLVELIDASPVVGATASIPTRGQVPIGFRLNVRSDVDTHDGTYGLVAEISSGGRVLFRNPVPVPVSDQAGAQSHIVVNYAPEPIIEPVQPLPTAELLDTIWIVTSIGGRPVTGDVEVTLSIAADHRAGGSGGCNNFFTEATLVEQTLSFGPAAATRMACDAAIMAQEDAYFTALAAVVSYEQDKHGLRLLDAAGIPLVGLVRATE